MEASHKRIWRKQNSPSEATQLPVEHNLLRIQATYVVATSITTQARHDCEKIAITGLEPASLIAI